MPRTTLSPRRRAAAVAVGALGLALAAVPTLIGGPAQASTSALPNPVKVGSGVRNVVFYYGGAVPLDMAHYTQLKHDLGSPAVIVAPPATTTSGIRVIHKLGAKAYRYAQYYWAPGPAAGQTTKYDGLTLSSRLSSWAFCTAPGKPARGRTVGHTQWYFMDANNAALHKQIDTRMKALHTSGWDGLMFDRGQAATQSATTSDKHPVWYAKSNCGLSVKKVASSATFADSYVALTRLAQADRLGVMFNNGVSPYDTTVHMRPNPANAACRAHKWSSCKTLGDVWSSANLVVNESAAAPKLQNWTRNFVGNSLSEQHAVNGHRTVALLTTGTLGGASGQTKQNVFYEWGRVRLFNIAVAVNTGTRATATKPCATTANTGICNHYGVYPALTNIAFGAPLASKPASTKCAGSSRTSCVWFRRYANGLEIVNATSATHKLTGFSLGLSRCTHVLDRYTGKPLAGNKCVKKVTVTTGAWSGHPLLFKSTRW